MTDPEIFELMDRFENSSLRAMKLSTPGFTLELERDGAAAPAPAPAQAAQKPGPEQRQGQTINAPLLGTFYTAPGPDQPPFAAVGARVSKGQTVCLLEAMKMMSEVAAPCDCVIEEVLKTNGQLAAFGEPLFRIKPC